MTVLDFLIAAAVAVWFGAVVLHAVRRHGKGCGACTVTCPSGAMDLNGFSTKQIMAEVDAICR